MKLDTSAAPELALLAAPATGASARSVASAVPPGAAAPQTAVAQGGDPVPAASATTGTVAAADGGKPPGGPAHAGEGAPVTVGYLAACLRILVADPRRWWDLVRFDPQRPVRIPVAAPAPGCGTWLLVLPPGQHGEEPGPAPPGGVSCLLAGAVTEQTGTPGGWQDRPLSPGRTRVHGGRGPSRLINSGAGYAVTLHARALPG